MIPRLFTFFRKKAGAIFVSNDGETVKFSIGENEHRGGTHGGGDTPTGAVAAAASTCSGINEDTDEQHRPHQLFCEMDELQENVEWKEAARWLKFEEDVELGGRWSKPHVATLQLHSLFELRSCLVNGATLLDFPGDDLPSIVEALIDSCVRLKILEEPHKDEVRNALLLKHVHQHEKEFQKQLSNGEKKSFPFVKSLADLGKKVSHVDLREATSSTPPITAKPSSSLLTTSNIGPMNMSSANLKQSSTQPVFELTGSQARIPKVDSKQKDFLTSIGSTASVASNASTYNFKINQNFMRKIPTGAEASNVLVGEVDFLDYQFSAFVRLSRSVVLGDFTEVPVPTRFLFIILGPKGNITKYHEIGRSISTLMSDELFHDVAYKAKNKQELLDAFDLFLDQVTVLPPGEWDPKIRLDPPSKIPQKEERLERIAEVHKLNGSVQNGLKKSDEELHPHELDPGLTFTGRFCGGLIDDVKRKVPWFVSDFTDGLNFQCLSSILFMYFACLSPIITFGGLLGTATDFNMSAIESLVSGAVCGILYSLFAGQPMTIMGSTGPVLVFETIVNSFSKEHGIDYMGFRAWIGLWTALILMIIVVTDCSALVKYITRFTEESFATLIAFIFIKESVLKLLEIRKSYVFDNDPTKYVNQFVEANNTDCYRCLFKNEPAIGNSSFTTLPAAIPVNYSMLNEQECNKLGAQFEFSKRCQYTPDVFFVSVVLYIVTFSLAMLFRFFRTSRFFPSLVRSKVSDFGVVITIVIAVSLDSMLNFNTPKLIVPIKFETTIPTRGWFINPLQRNSDKLFWLVPAAIFPALLATILIFMDQHITAVIVNRKENKLKKSSGYHLDMLIVAITIAINSLLGIPWFVAATVLSINHVLSLKKESESSAPGEKPKFLGVIEQRLTGTVVFALIGSSVFLAKLLRKIPMPVLYGIFLYMGISSLNGIQFMHRIVLIFMPEKHQPDYIFLRHVRTFKVHIFTIIQILCLAMLFIIKMNKSISITFPLMVLALVGIRKLMDYMFTQKELSYLDDIMPEIVKRSKEDGKDVNEVDEFAVRKLPKNDSINITQELSKTHIWKELVSSDKQLEEEPKLFRRKSSKKRKMSLTLKDNNNSPNTSNNAAVPTSQPSSRTATSPNQKPSHTSIMMNSNIPAIDEDVPLMSSPGSNFGSSPVPQIVVFNSRTPAQSPIQENQTKL